MIRVIFLTRQQMLTSRENHLLTITDIDDDDGRDDQGYFLRLSPTNGNESEKSPIANTDCDDDDINLEVTHYSDTTAVSDQQMSDDDNDVEVEENGYLALDPKFYKTLFDITDWSRRGQ